MGCKQEKAQSHLGVERSDSAVDQRLFVGHVARQRDALQDLLSLSTESEERSLILSAMRGATHPLGGFEHSIADLTRVQACNAHSE